MIFLRLILACSSDKSVGTSSDSNSDTTTETKFEATAGGWYAESMDVVSNSCG